MITPSPFFPLSGVRTGTPPMTRYPAVRSPFRPPRPLLLHRSRLACLFFFLFFIFQMSPSRACSFLFPSFCRPFFVFSTACSALSFRRLFAFPFRDEHRRGAREHSGPNVSLPFHFLSFWTLQHGSAQLTPCNSSIFCFATIPESAPSTCVVVRFPPLSIGNVALSFPPLFPL